MKGFSYTMPILSPCNACTDDQSWRLEREMTVTLAGKFRVTVPRGFVTDGASIPRALWRVCGHPFEIPRIYAAILHDYLYAGGVHGITRAEADCAYREMLIRLGVSPVVAWVEWTAIRICGGTHWHDGEESDGGEQ